MKFWVSRASLWHEADDDTSPHPATIRTEYANADSWGRRFGWVVILQTLEELVDFIDKCEYPAIIERDKREELCLKIYDDHVE